jgi:hypothetical protein
MYVGPSLVKSMAPLHLQITDYVTLFTSSDVVFDLFAIRLDRLYDCDKSNRH